jgi:hypothetical protein
MEVFFACWDQKNRGFSSKPPEVFSWEDHRGLCEFSTMELIEDVQVL